MDLRKLKKLIDLVEESGIAELEITEGEEKVRISKSHDPAVKEPPPQYVQPWLSRGRRFLSSRLAQAAANPAPAESIPEGHVVKSPMVGTFYRIPTRRQRFRRGRADGQGRRNTMHHRGDEASRTRLSPIKAG